MLDAPAGTVTDEAAVATAVLELVSLTAVPPFGERPLRLTVPVELVPPVTVEGSNEIEAIEIGSCVSVAD